MNTRNIILLLVLIANSLFSQNENPISNFNVSINKSLIKINYDLLDSKKYLINFYYRLENDSSLLLPSDYSNYSKIKNRTNSNNSYTWSYNKTLPNFQGNVKVVLQASPVLKINTFKHLTKSIIYPGWGSVTNPQKKIIFGKICYLSIIAGTAIYIDANTDYYLYKNSLDKVESELLYKRANYKRAAGLTLAGTSSLIWSINLISVYNKIKRLKKKGNSIKYEDSPYYFDKIKKKYYVESYKLSIDNRSKGKKRIDSNLVSYNQGLYRKAYKTAENINIWVSKNEPYLIGEANYQLNQFKIQKEKCDNIINDYKFYLDNTKMSILNSNYELASNYLDKVKNIPSKLCSEDKKKYNYNQIFELEKTINLNIELENIKELTSSKKFSSAYAKIESLKLNFPSNLQIKNIEIVLLDQYWKDLYQNHKYDQALKYLKKRIEFSPNNKILLNKYSEIENILATNGLWGDWNVLFKDHDITVQIAFKEYINSCNSNNLNRNTEFKYKLTGSSQTKKEITWDLDFIGCDGILRTSSQLLEIASFQSEGEIKSLDYNFLSKSIKRKFYNVKLIEKNVFNSKNKWSQFYEIPTQNGLQVKIRFRQSDQCYSKQTRCEIKLYGTIPYNQNYLKFKIEYIDCQGNNQFRNVKIKLTNDKIGTTLTNDENGNLRFYSSEIITDFDESKIKLINKNVFTDKNKWSKFYEIPTQNGLQVKIRFRQSNQCYSKQTRCEVKINGTIPYNQNYLKFKIEYIDCQGNNQFRNVKIKLTNDKIGTTLTNDENGNLRFYSTKVITMITDINFSNY